MRAALIQVGWFALGVSIGLGYVYVSRPHRAESAPPGATAKAAENTREAVASSGNDSTPPEGADGPASMAFADPAGRRTE